MRRLLVFLLAAASFSAQAVDSDLPEAATGFGPVAEALGQRFMAVTANLHASEAALEILDLGGSAADAAIAAQLVLNVVEPQSSGIGGGGFLLFRDARQRRTVAYDGRETAPRAASADFALGSDGSPLRFDQLVATGKSVGTPGLVAMLEMVHQAHGRLRWERLFRPAIRLAANGFAVSPRLHALFADDPFLANDSQARVLFYPDGTPLAVGAWLINAELAETLRLLAREGSRGFYRGKLAGDMVRMVKSRGGVLERSDLESYRPVRRQPVCAPFRQWRVCGMPPPSSGGIAVAQILGLLARKASPRLHPSDADAVHLFAEAGRLAFADRARYVADPDFVAVPTTDMLADDYLDQRARLLDSERSMGQASPGAFGKIPHQADAGSSEIPATTHISIVDGDGNAVALTSSIESGFGSRILVRGFLLNNQLTDFSFLAMREGRPVANRLEAGKRPMSSMAPTLVFDAAQRLAAVLGSAGGPRIINYTARAAWSMLAGGLTPAQALALPHVGNRNGPTELEQGTDAEGFAAGLRRRGHAIGIVPMNSGLHVIRRQGTDWVGAADPRREGVALGR